jgi:hypothetical protein
MQPSAQSDPGYLLFTWRRLMLGVSEPIVETLVFSINPVLQCMTPLRIAFATQAAVERPPKLQNDDY